MKSGKTLDLLAPGRRPQLFPPVDDESSLELKEKKAWDIMVGGLLTPSANTKGGQFSDTVVRTTEKAHEHLRSPIKLFQGFLEDRREGMLQDMLIVPFLI